VTIFKQFFESGVNRVLPTNFAKITESADSDSMVSENNKKQLLFAGQIKRAPKPTKKSQIFHLHAMYFILKQERKVQYFLT
jgi:hypothetical protein